MSLLLGSLANTPEPDLSVSSLSLFMERSSVLPLALMEVRGVLVPVPLVDPFSLGMPDELFLAAYYMPMKKSHSQRYPCHPGSVAFLPFQPSASV